MNEKAKARRRAVIAATVLTDLGRGTEKRDCTVRAFAAAFSVTYEAAHKLMADCGRGVKRPFLLQEALASPLVRCYGKVSFSWLSAPSPRLYTLLKRLSATGRYILGIEGHVFAVVNGKIIDNWVLKAGILVNRLWVVRPSPTRPNRCVREFDESC